MTSFNGWGSTVAKLQSHYEQIHLCNSLKIEKWRYFFYFPHHAGKGRQIDL